MFAAVPCSGAGVVMDGWGAVVCIMLGLLCVVAVMIDGWIEFWRDADDAFTPPDDRKDLR